MSTRKFSQGTLEATEYTVKIALLDYMLSLTCSGNNWRQNRGRSLLACRRERDGSIGFTSPRKEKSKLQAD
jgi:hypothetical protein